MGKVTSGQLADLGAGVCAVISGKGQQGANFIEGEPEFARTSDEGEGSSLD